MATVKILYDSETKHLEEYLKRNQDKNMFTVEHSCSLEGVTKEFAGVQRDHNSKGNSSLHLIQSWSPEESKKLNPEQVNSMGVELVTRFAPGHQFVVQTHDDQPHLHNHILVNPVNLETGKRIQNKLGNIRTVRNLNDDIARENGLSVLPPQEKLTRPGPNEQAKRIEAYRGRSYILDLSKKARFARAHATNYDEYLSILGAFDIQARIEPANITYFYPGRTHGKRGRNLDPDLDKSGLEFKFAENLNLITRNPDLKQGLTEILKRTPEQSDQSGVIRRTSEPITNRRDETFTVPRANILQQSLIPVAAFNEAKTRSIFDYCEREKIELNHTRDGRSVLRDREALEVTEYSWINHKNKTRGNIIDFVSNHRRVNFLQSVAILTNNPRLLILEQYVGQEQSQYRPFLIPKQDSASRPDALLALSRFLGRTNQRDEFNELFKQQRVQVTSLGAIRFLSEREGSDYTDYVLNPSDKYVQKRTGAKTAFYSKLKNTKQVELYSDPKALLIHRPDSLRKGQPDQSGILALLEPSIEAVHRAVASQSKLKEIVLVGTPSCDDNPDFQNFYEELKQSLNPFSIDVTLAWEPLARSQAFQKSRDSGLGQRREISFFHRG